MRHSMHVVACVYMKTVPKLSLPGAFGENYLLNYAKFCDMKSHFELLNVICELSG
jgi:hypothetical protein